MTSLICHWTLCRSLYNLLCLRLMVAEDLRQSVKAKPDVKRSRVSLDKVQSLLSPWKSLRLQEAQNLTLRGGLTYEQDIECNEEGRPWQSTLF
uniref:uncharacterized protein LOC124049970 n=1 Tax=Scatophagus argus TaxID=75038 RepID=UPI001ED825E0|nr:uncharacterized protein LOC124049970 [Scatophagus argus]